MSSARPAALTMSLDAFSQRGGGNAPHADGWGIAYYDDGDVRRIRDTEAAAGNHWVGCLREHGLRSRLVIAHVRKATLGEKILPNTQPFARELGGRVHVFAHNGHVPAVRESPTFALNSRRPIGNTDSEWAFCNLLHRMEPLWAGGELPSVRQRADVVLQFAEDLRACGIANFLYADGELVFLHGHRRPLDGGKRSEPPGLCFLERTCGCGEEAVQGGGVQVASPCEQRVLIAATAPLTGEAWSPLAEGEVAVFRNGELLFRTGDTLPTHNPATSDGIRAGS